MSLARGTGPLSRRPGGLANYTVEGPKHKLWWEGDLRRVRGIVAGETVVDSRRAKLLLETGIGPVWYFPAEDLRAELLQPSDSSTHCPYKGDAAYWTLRVGDDVREDLVWGYDDPVPGAAFLAGHRAFYFNRVDTWLQEDQEIRGHPHDPYHRIDVLACSRHVVVEVDGQVVAETTQPMLLLETGLPPRYYLARGDVRAEVLLGSDTTTECPYKGTARYHSVQVGGRLLEDLVWHYPEPLPEAAGIADRLSFYNHRVDLVVDGEREAAQDG